ncbi:MAG: sugar ABC transporter substrate-binding protein [Candidatus Marinimicrobia bacterium]|nr:sugar ABC transporter substrate-binding protein [Candidatus Neomarinimicrobiota bacterium]
MRRFISFLMYYKGFFLTGILALLVILFYISGERSIRSKSEKPQTGPIKFLSLAWQEEAVQAVREITDNWNQLHPDQPVEFMQGSWNAVHDYLITGFETGDIPDIFHYESATIVDFALRDYLADLSPYISQEMKEDILEVDWASVTRSNGEIVGIPFLAATSIILYNTRLFSEAGIEAPSFNNPWTWNDLMEAAKKLTMDRDHDGSPDQWGMAMGLRNSANLIMNNSIAFGGSFFYYDDEGNLETRVSEPERELLGKIYALLYEDKTMSPSSIGKSGPEMIPGFLADNYAMVVGIGAWARQQVVENAGTGFQWAAMPMVKAKTQALGVNTQTMSIPKMCKRQDQAMEFVQFLLSPENMTRLAASDWMMPTSRTSLAAPQFQESSMGWDVVCRSSQYLSTGPWIGLPGYIEWKSRVANPVFQEYFSGRISLDETAERIEKESNSVLARYQVRGLKW